MIRKLAAILLILSMQGSTDRTVALHAEVLSHDTPNLMRETHPLLYELVEELVAAARTVMPRYVSTYPVRHAVVSEHGSVREYMRDMLAYIDITGDLYICREILTNLSYDEIKGILAVAIAEKSVDRPTKLALMGVGTFAVTAASVYGLNTYYDLNLGDGFFSYLKPTKQNYSFRDREDLIGAIITALIIPSIITTNVLSNHLQKTIDREATKIVDPQAIINGVRALQKLQESYRKPDIFSRIAEKLDLTKIYNILFYPIRASTLEERIDYLQQQAAS